MPNKTIEIIREQLADYAHTAWSGWMKHLFKQSKPTIGGEVIIPVGLVERWKMQMNTDYKDLPEDMKPSDRKEADRMLAIVELDTVTRQRDEAVRLVKKHEWAGHTPTVGGHLFANKCPECLEDEKDGHKSDCAINKFLTELKEEKDGKL